MDLVTAPKHHPSNLQSPSLITAIMWFVFPKACFNKQQQETLRFAQLFPYPTAFLPSEELFLLRKSLAPRSGCSDPLGSHFMIPSKGSGCSTKISYSPSKLKGFPH